MSGCGSSNTADANGNRVTKTLNGATDTYTSDAGDKLTAITGANPKTFAYDACGRTTSITAGGVSTNFSYDYEDRVTQITRSGMTTNSFGYNGVGTRVSKTDSSGSATFMRNGVGVTAPVLSDGAATYTPGVGERRGSTTKHYGADLKNEVAQISTMQTISASKQYDAFGNVTSSSGTFNGPFSYGGKFGYQTDSDTSYQLLGHRYYDSSTGRFLSRDGARDSGNWFAYCSNNPTSYEDAAGLWRRPGSGADYGAGRGLVDPAPPTEPKGVTAGRRAREWATNKSGEYIKRWSGKGNTGAFLYTDCAWFVVQCYKGLVKGFPQWNASEIHAWMNNAKKNNGQFVRVANDENYEPQPGDIWVRKGNPHGHIIIVGDDGEPYDASLGDHKPEHRTKSLGRTRRGKKRPKPGSDYEIWRPV